MVTSPLYKQIPTADPEDGNLEDKISVQRPSRKLRFRLWIFGSCFLIVLFSLAIFKWAPFSSLATATAGTCRSPVLRREWRSLRNTQKRRYIDAVVCLREQQSLIGLNQSAYDDFPYLHSNFGNVTHETAGFLPWHRYFLHLYEGVLRNQCGYKGPMPYWDWTLDWHDFENAPVWSAELGFGSNGGADAPKSISEGRCVVDGPFSNAEMLWAGSAYLPHCLSRGFTRFDEMKRRMLKIKPEAIEEVLLIKKYYDFSLALEDGPHLSIPHSIRGDFYSFTAPNDPVFFLHHAQLDRLWWRWQREDQASKAAWGGKAWATSAGDAQLEDTLDVGALARPISADAIMSTESDLLCYRY